MAKDFGAGFHVAPGRDVVDAQAYEAWIGRWSRLFVTSVLAAARISPGDRVLDVSTGTGEAALRAGMMLKQNILALASAITQTPADALTIAGGEVLGADW